MASVEVHLPTGHASSMRTQQPSVVVASTDKSHHVQTTLNFLKEKADGSHLAPNYVGNPQTYERPTEAVPVTVHDISGHELEYTLDSHGFQIYHHTSRERDFLDDEKVKREYYPETEQLLKDAYVKPIWLNRLLLSP